MAHERALEDGRDVDVEEIRELLDKGAGATNPA